MGHDPPGQLDGHVRLLADAPSKLIGLRSDDQARFGGLFYGQSLYSQEELDAIADEIKNRPRKGLGVRSPLSV